MTAAEASVVAPFSSQKGSVMTCVDLLTEGRCALATSIASYKYLVIYGLLFSIVKMCSFYYAILMPLMGYVMIDIVAVVPLTFAMTLSRPLNHLGPKRPTSSLLGVQTVSSVAGFLIIATCTMAINLGVMTSSDGYVRWPSHGADTAAWWFISDNYESTVIWITCFLLFISSTFIFSFGSGFRDSVFKNFILVIYVIALYLFASLLLLLPLNWLSVKFHIATEQFNRIGTENPVWQKYQQDGGSPSPGMSFELRILIWFLSTLGVMIAMGWERLVVFGPIGKAMKSRFKKRFATNSPKSKLNQEFANF
jgi:cation-transporting ATPase 13A3/4/5